MKVPVLGDQGFVRYVDHMGSDLTVVNAARVSFKKSKEDMDQKDKNLISYLAKHRHWTPFAHPQVTLHIKAPVFVARQMFKHKVGATENEVSRRYVNEEPEFYIPEIWRQKPDGSIKQGSINENVANHRRVEELYKKAIQICNGAYEYSIIHGVAPELARAVLPQSMFTEWYWTVSLATAARIFRQRGEETAQMESQEYAWAIDRIVEPLFPVSWEALVT